MHGFSTLLAVLATVDIASAHIWLTYPSWRGDQFVTNGTVNTDDYKDDRFPYGMEWMYPCGGLKISENRTYWPINGGALSFQPGWFPGHQVGLIYVNMGLPDVYNEELGYKIPLNYSHNLVKPFQITGPTNDPYPGIGMCLPQIPMPAGVDFKEGMNVTLQVVLAAQHGAALFSCADVTLTSNMTKVPLVTPQNCHNDSQITFQQQYYTKSITPDPTGGAGMIQPQWLTVVALASMALLLL